MFKTKLILWFSVLLIIISSGCVHVEIVDRESDDLGDTHPSPPLQHNLIARDISFDPPLDEIGRPALRQGVILYVTVENDGLETEEDVRVHVSLTVAGDESPLVLQEGSISSIAPGDSAQAAFELHELVDQHPHYILQVSVDSCEGESRLSDNQRTFDLYVTPLQ